MRLNNFSYLQRDQDPHGKCIIVGMMEDGPTGAPFTLTDKTSAAKLLGDNEVTRSYDLLIANEVPKENIILFRLNGTPSIVEVNLNGIDVMYLQTLTSHSDGGAISLTISEEGFTLMSNYTDEAKEERRRKDFTRTYLFEEYPYTHQLAEAISNDAMFAMHDIWATSIHNVPTSRLSESTGIMAFQMGDEESPMATKNGVFPEGSIEDEGSFLNKYWTKFYYHLLGPDFDGEASSNIMGISAEAIYFPDLPVDEMPEIAILAGRVANQKTIEQNLLCMALFRTNLVPLKRELLDGEFLTGDGEFFNTNTDQNEPWLPLKEKKEFVEKLENLFTPEEKTYPELNNVQIVVGESDDASGDIIPGASFHLVNLISEDLHSRRNQEIPYFGNIYSPLDKNDIDKLTTKGYICIVDSIRRSIVKTKATTPYISTQLKEQFIFRKTTSYISYDLRQLLDQFISSNISAYEARMIEDLLDEYLQQYVDDGIMHSFSLGEGVYDPESPNANIPIEIVMYGSIDDVRGTVRLNETGWGVDLWSL